MKTRKKDRSKKRPLNMNSLLYFGVIENVGHDMWLDESTLVLPASSEMKSVQQLTGSPWIVRDEMVVVPWDMIDCVLCPGARVARPGDGKGDVLRKDQREGEYALHHRDGWTALAWWDRSGRNGFWSNSVLLMRGKFSAQEIIAKAHVQFPNVMKRMDYQFVEGKFCATPKARREEFVDVVTIMDANKDKRVAKKDLRQKRHRKMRTA